MKRYFTLLCIAASCYFNSTSLSAQAFNVNDSLALVDLYNSTNGPNWADHTNWLQGPVNTWSWLGLTPDKTRVRSLFYFSQRNLDGVIPASLGNLTSCEFINFHGNNLRGSIPASLGNLVNVKK